MFLLYTGVALAEPSAIVAVTIEGPDGSVKMIDEVPLPGERILTAPDGKHLLRLYVSTFDTTRAVVELSAGKPKKGVPKVKVATSYELDPYKPRTESFAYKTQTWKVTTMLGAVWDAPALAPAAEDPSRYVLAWDDAALIKDPKVPTTFVTERALPSGRTDPVEMASPMRVVDTWGETHLEIETVPGDSPSHCQRGGLPTEPYPLQYYVALKDLLPKVTAKEIQKDYPDGTGYHVAAGVPVVEEGEGRYRVMAGRLSFLVEATEQEIAFFYRPTAHFAIEEAPMSLLPGTLGQTELGPVTLSGHEPIGIAAMRGVVTPIATVRTPCAEVRLRPAEGAIDPAHGR